MGNLRRRRGVRQVLTDLPDRSSVQQPLCDAALSKTCFSAVLDRRPNVIVSTTVEVTRCQGRRAPFPLHAESRGRRGVGQVLKDPPGPLVSTMFFWLKVLFSATATCNVQHCAQQLVPLHQKGVLGFVIFEVSGTRESRRLVPQVSKDRPVRRSIRCSSRQPRASPRSATRTSPRC